MVAYSKTMQREIWLLADTFMKNGSTKLHVCAYLVYHCGVEYASPKLLRKIFQTS